MPLTCECARKENCADSSAYPEISSHLQELVFHNRFHDEDLFLVMLRIIADNYSYKLFLSVKELQTQVLQMQVSTCCTFGVIMCVTKASNSMLLLYIESNNLHT